MDFQHLKRQFTGNAQRIRQLVAGVPADQARWKPDAESWSILEVINHLYDEERFDFRVRLDIILHRPDEPWPPIDPQGWVTSRQYNGRELQASLEGFLSEREASLQWLESLAPNWESVYQARFGSIRAGDMFAAWVAHDLLHMRQLVELLWEYTLTLADPYSVRYAGDW